MRQFIISVSTTAAVCLGYASTGPFAAATSGGSDNPTSVSAFEEAKTDFISVAVFDGEKVRGYLSFRVSFSISDAARAGEVGYLASDVSILNAPSFSAVNSNLTLLAKQFENDIKVKIGSALPANLVESVRIIDFAYDVRT